MRTTSDGRRTGQVGRAKRPSMARVATTIAAKATDKRRYKSLWKHSRPWVLGIAGSVAAVVFAFGAAVRMNASAHSLDTVDEPALQIENIIAPDRTGGKPVRTTLQPGEDLRALLHRAAVPYEDADRIANALSQTFPLDNLAPGTSFDLGYGPEDAKGKRTISTLVFRPRMDLAVEVLRKDGSYLSRRIPVAVMHSPLRIYGQIDTTLADSLLNAGVPKDDVATYQAIVATQVPLANISRGDRFDIVIEQDVASTGDRQIGDLIYAGLYRSNGQNVQMSQWTQDGRVKWFDAERVGPTSDAVQRPVPGEVSSDYGRRMHPILGYTRMHKGLDFKAGYGTPILAVQTGWVGAAGWAGGYGRQVRLTHGAGIETTYSHMSSIVAQPGELVHQGQIIGYVGATGLATGPHLHYELHQYGVAIDPTVVQFATRSQLAGNDLVGYQARLAALLRVPVGKAYQGGMDAQVKRLTGIVTASK